MALAPLRTGPHTIRADRLAFATPVPVREASAAGHWITLHAAESDEGTVHVYVGGGGYIEKGPASLVHQHIGQLASHPSVARTTRHPAGHEPDGARSHPQFIEAGAKPRPSAPSASVKGAEGEPAKAPGKPYARLSGVEQGRRTEQVGKALGEAQSRAAARAARDRRDRPRSPEHAAERAASDDRDRAEAAHFHAAGTFDRSGNPRGGSRTTRDAVRATRTQHEAAGHRVAIAASKAEVERLRQKAAARAPQKSPQESAPADASGKKATFGERREATVKAMQDKAQRERATYHVLGTSDDQTTCEICGKKDLKKTVALHHDQSGEVVRAGSDCAAELLKTSRGSIEKAAQQHGEKREAAIQKALESHANQEIIKRFAGQIDRINAYHRGQKTTPSDQEQGKIAFARQRMADLTAEARRDIEKQLPADKPLSQGEVEQRVVHGRTVRTEKPATPFATPQKPPEEKIADTAVVHQQAQAELAAHRAAHDRNPNPWAPHLSPPVGDAKDRELAEKATRAQLAHQAAQAQQQGAQQAQQTEGQRAHEKELVRLKHEQATEQSARAAGASASDARILANQVRAGHGLIRGKRPPNPEQAQAFSAPQPKAQETPRTAPQPEQAAGVPRSMGGELPTLPFVAQPTEEHHAAYARVMDDLQERHQAARTAAEEHETALAKHQDRMGNIAARQATRRYKQHGSALGGDGRDSPSAQPQNRAKASAHREAAAAAHQEAARVLLHMNRLRGDHPVEEYRYSRRHVRESASPAPRFSAPVASAR